METNLEALSSESSSSSLLNSDLPYKCKVAECTKSFPNNQRLRAHNKTHLELRPFVCNWHECGKTFKYYSTLEIHERIHFTDKRYRCNICSKKFVQKSTLINHKKSHFNVKIRLPKIKRVSCNNL